VPRRTVSFFHCRLLHAFPPMKVTLNDAIPEANRPTAVEIVHQMSPGAEITWLPSRFPRLVMLVEPNPKHIETSSTGSMFGEEVRSEFALQLEDRLQRGLRGLRGDL